MAYLLATMWCLRVTRRPASRNDDPPLAAHTWVELFGESCGVPAATPNVVVGQGFSKRKTYVSIMASELPAVSVAKTVDTTKRVIVPAALFIVAELCWRPKPFGSFSSRRATCGTRPQRRSRSF